MIGNQVARKPQIALHLLARQMHQPVTRIGRGVLWTDTRHVLGEPGTPPVQPTRSASTVAGIVGNCTNSTRTAGSICAHAEVTDGLRS